MGFGMTAQTVVGGDEADLREDGRFLRWRNPRKSPLSPAYRPFIAPISKVRSGEDSMKAIGGEGAAKVGILDLPNDFKEKADVSVLGIPSGCYRHRLAALI
jgi:hypothetical protein